MDKFYKCVLSVANLFLWLTVLAAIAALFAPFWINIKSILQVTSGLYLVCLDPYGSNAHCKWATPDNVRKCYQMKLFHILLFYN